MEALIHLDSHVLVWLSMGEPERLPATARRRIEAEPLGFSPFAELELQFLFEIGRIREPGRNVVAGLASALGLLRSSRRASELADAASSLSWTRDPFDRLIVANAMADGAALLTKDERIRERFADAFWE